MRSRLLLLAAAAGILLPWASAGAIDLKTQITGTSSGSGKLSRTITDISEPPPAPQRVQATYGVTVTIPSGASAATAAGMLIDSINAQIGAAGFTASLLGPGFVQMSRGARFSSDDKGKIPGLTVVSGDMLVFAQHQGHGSPPGAQPQPSFAEQGAGRVTPLGAERGAGIPDGTWCTVDPSIVVCPAGDLPPFHVNIRDYFNVPCRSVYVFLAFSGPSLCSNPNVTMLTDGLGVAAFTLAMGGGCPFLSVSTEIAGFLGTRFVASPDQNGDGIVNGYDLTLLAAKIGTTDPTGDLDGDGVVSGSSTTGVGDVPPWMWPRLTLSGVWPNVLHPGGLATLTYFTPRGTDLVLELFDPLGRRAWTQPIGAVGPGPHRLGWRVPEAIRPGLYSLRLRSDPGEGDAKRIVVR